MQQEIPQALQVMLYAAAIAVIVLTAVVVFFVMRLRKQLERVVHAVETFENEIVPFAREGRIMATRVRDLSDGMQRIVGIVGDLVIPPVAAFNKASRVVQTASTTFVRSLWNGPQVHGR